MYKKRLVLAALMLVAILTFAACATRIISGSGDLISETRHVSDFDRIEVSGSGEVIVTQGGSESLTIETDDNIMEYIQVDVEDRTLKLGFKKGFNIVSATRLLFYVGVDDLTGLSVSGSGDVESDRLETGRLDISVSGSGDVQITGLTAGEVIADISGSGEIILGGDLTSQDISVSGSGKYLTGEICSEAVKVSVSGSGNATVCAVETLDADVSGSGSVNYYGQPSTNNSVSGSGKINSLGVK